MPVIIFAIQFVKTLVLVVMAAKVRPIPTFQLGNFPQDSHFPFAAASSAKKGKRLGLCFFVLFGVR